jgi:hypothetical protein
MKDPRPGLDALGVQWEQVVDPDDGYDGTFTPEVLMLHWTASAAGSDVSSHVVVINDYHCCVSRSGVAKLGGWKVRQAHGGKGRVAPIETARRGAMTVDELKAWQLSPVGDDTDSMPNRYGLSVAVDNNGVGEPVPDVQWEAFTATAAVMLDCIDRITAGYLIDHSASTNRKIDLATSPALPVDDWYRDIGHQLDRLHDIPSGAIKMYQYLQDDRDQMWLSDKLTVRWLVSAWDDANCRDKLDDLGLPTQPMKVKRQSIKNGEFGVIIGTEPPW